MSNLLSEVHPELVLEWSERNLPLTPDKITYGSNKIVWWIGTCGHEWQTSVKARSSGEKCPICSGARAVEGINDLVTLKPELAAEWSSKNNPLKPTMVTVGSHKKVIWKGKCGHEWTATVKSRAISGTGCPYCSHNKVLEGFNDLASQRPLIASEWSERNYPLKPNMVTVFANRKVWWKCSKGHEWNTLISTRSGGSQCPYCSGQILLKGFNDFATTHPQLAQEWSDRNLPLTPDMINEKSRKNVWWKCRECGNEWQSVVYARIRGTICPVCADRAVMAGYNDLATTDAHLLSEWDYEKNKGISPNKVSRNSMRSVWWKCSLGHSWKAKISERAIEEKGCTVCEKDYLTVFPKLAVMFYAAMKHIKVQFDTVRQKEDGRYELISGHRRKRACELAGFETLRCEVVDLDRDEATILMVESNFQRSQMGGYSIYGASLDGVDPCLRMEGLMADEMGGKEGWKIEKCFLIEDSREVADIIHGDFFIARSNIADEKYDSLTQEQMLTYKRLFRYPERFHETAHGIEIESFKPDRAEKER